MTSTTPTRSPKLGGAASVWSVAMVFFQTALLAGYAYAHLLTRFAPGRAAVVIHLVVMAVACVALPLHIAAGWGRPPPVGESFWLLGLFTVSIGLPFFALAVNGPLMQAWFVRTGHPAARDPYFLYAASNARSFLALIAYPLVIEPFVRLGHQTWVWTICFYVLPVDRRLRRAVFALTRSGARIRGRRRWRGRRGTGVARPCVLDRARRGAVRPPDRGHRSCRNRRRGGAAAMGVPPKNAIVNAYAFYIRGRKAGVPKNDAIVLTDELAKSLADLTNGTIATMSR